MTVKGKTDTNSYPFAEDKHLLCVCYPFECFKKLFKDASRASLLALAKSVTINKIETRGL